MSKELVILPGVSLSLSVGVEVTMPNGEKFVLSNWRGVPKEIKQQAATMEDIEIVGYATKAYVEKIMEAALYGVAQK